MTDERKKLDIAFTRETPWFGMQDVNTGKLACGTTDGIVFCDGDRNPVEPTDEQRAAIKKFWDLPRTTPEPPVEA